MSSASNNAKLWPKYQVQLRQLGDTFLRTCSILTRWLSNPRAYYDAARPQIILLFEIAHGTLTEDNGGLPYLFRESSTALLPFGEAYRAMVETAHQHKDCFTDPGILASLERLYLTVLSKDEHAAQTTQDKNSPHAAEFNAGSSVASSSKTPVALVHAETRKAKSSEPGSSNEKVGPPTASARRGKPPRRVTLKLGRQKSSADVSPSSTSQTTMTQSAEPRATSASSEGAQPPGKTPRLARASPLIVEPRRTLSGDAPRARSMSIELLDGPPPAKPGAESPRKLEAASKDQRPTTAKKIPTQVQNVIKEEPGAPVGRPIKRVKLKLSTPVAAPTSASTSKDLISAPRSHHAVIPSAELEGPWASDRNGRTSISRASAAENTSASPSPIRPAMQNINDSSFAAPTDATAVSCTPPPVTSTPQPECGPAAAIGDSKASQSQPHDASSPRAAAETVGLTGSGTCLVTLPHDSVPAAMASPKVVGEPVLTVATAGRDRSTPPPVTKNTACPVQRVLMPDVAEERASSSAGLITSEVEAPVKTTVVNGPCGPISPAVATQMLGEPSDVMNKGNPVAPSAARPTQLARPPQHVIFVNPHMGIPQVIRPGAPFASPLGWSPSPRQASPTSAQTIDGIVPGAPSTMPATLSAIPVVSPVVGAISPAIPVATPLFLNGSPATSSAFPDVPSMLPIGPSVSPVIPLESSTPQSTISFPPSRLTFTSDHPEAVTNAATSGSSSLVANPIALTHADVRPIATSNQDTAVVSPLQRADATTQVVQARKKKKKRPAIQVDFMALDKQAYEKRKQRESVGSPAVTPPPGAVVYGQPTINAEMMPRNGVTSVDTGTSNAATKSSSKVLSPSRDRPVAFGTSSVSIPEVRHPLPSPLRPWPIVQRVELSEVATLAEQNAADRMLKRPENVSRPQSDETTKTVLNSASPAPMVAATNEDRSAIASVSLTSAKKYDAEGAQNHTPTAMGSVPPGPPTPSATGLENTDTSVVLGSTEGVGSGDVVSSISTLLPLTTELVQTNSIASQGPELVRAEQKSDPVMNTRQQLNDPGDFSLVTEGQLPNASPIAGSSLGGPASGSLSQRLLENSTQSVSTPPKRPNEAIDDTLHLPPKKRRKKQIVSLSIINPELELPSIADEIGGRADNAQLSHPSPVPIEDTVLKSEADRPVPLAPSITNDEPVSNATTGPQSLPAQIEGELALGLTGLPATVPDVAGLAPVVQNHVPYARPHDSPPAPGPPQEQPAAQDAVVGGSPHKEKSPPKFVVDSRPLVNGFSVLGEDATAIPSGLASVRRGLPVSDGKLKFEINIDDITSGRHLQWVNRWANTSSGLAGALCLSLEVYEHDACPPQMQANCDLRNDQAQLPPCSWPKESTYALMSVNGCVSYQIDLSTPGLLNDDGRIDLTPYCKLGLNRLEIHHATPADNYIFVVRIHPPTARQGSALLQEETRWKELAARSFRNEPLQTNPWAPVDKRIAMLAGRDAV